MPQTQ